MFSRRDELHCTDEIHFSNIWWFDDGEQSKLFMPEMASLAAPMLPWSRSKNLCLLQIRGVVHMGIWTVYPQCCCPWFYTQKVIKHSPLHRAKRFGSHNDCPVNCSATSQHVSPSVLALLKYRNPKTGLTTAQSWRLIPYMCGVTLW